MEINGLGNVLNYCTRDIRRYMPFLALFHYINLWKDLLQLIRQDSSRPFGELMLHARSGSLKPTDALILARLLRKHRPTSILEIGSFLGISTRFILDVSSSWAGKVVAVDPNIPHRVFAVPRNYVKLLNSVYIPQRLEIATAYFGKPIDGCTSDVPVIESGWENTFDFIFIDGDHSYETVMLNFGLALTMLKKGGVIAFHDAISWEGVEKALKDIADEYKGMALVEIYGHSHRNLLKLFGRANDGVGVFRFV